jgi:acylphosphatase
MRIGVVVGDDGDAGVCAQTSVTVAAETRVERNAKRNACDKNREPDVHIQEISTKTDEGNEWPPILRQRTGECNPADSLYTVSMLVARRLVVIGHVQGVGFRMFTADAARAEGLTGWVQNRTDGAVEIVAEGDRDAVARFEARIRRGPSRSRIERVVGDDDTPSGRAAGFTIRG